MRAASRGEPVAVTGLGLITPAGVGVEAGWRTLCDGVSTASEDPVLQGTPVPFSCRVPDIDAAEAVGRKLTWRTDSFIHFAVAAAREAVADAGLDPRDACRWEADRVGVVMGVGATSQENHPREYAKLLRGQHTTLSPTIVPRSVPNMAAGEIAADLDARGANLCTSTACASGATAIGVARQLIASGACDTVIAGGSESARNSVFTALPFWRMGVLSGRAHDPAGASRPFDADRDGFVLGEGAGVMVLERLGAARARRARIHAVLAGFGATADAFHPVAPHPEGDGARRALLAALADAGLEAGDIGHVNAHATATRRNDLVEGRVLREVFPHFPPVTATKSVIGHALGAAGAIEAVCSVLALARGCVPPTANLDRQDPEIDLDIVQKTPCERRLEAVASCSFGFGGQNAALVFRTP
ncbi:beta-ketoacyl-[acyl-carrier-protein] synthase family protein [Streptomyces sp. PR69]|uniref:beta-ketoacyl-[acyl-carrier-protein] synthase family protein n=1 Tax=Streptomyces sp. PR69 TaxID=2984950 RepID=UPI0022649AE1|nr:beta-ketoacyl-[acyl-carrier-protein] synthase family protein [Streptomyces sp. PR69]